MAQLLQGLTEGLNAAQREAVTTAASPLCILAGAGSGKTRVLTRRIAFRALEGTADARHVLALTFTRKAAGELSSRLASLGVRDQVVAGTFHSVAFAQLRRRWSDRGERAPTVLDRKVRLLAPLVYDAARRQGGSGRRSTVQPADIAAEIEWAKARLVAPGDYEAAADEGGRTPPLPPSVVARIFERYEADKARRGLVDFDDLLLACARAIETDSDFAAAQRWRFRHLFVDEFQDVNPVQFRLLEAWRGGRDDLCVVGDPNQAIYSWNGADPTLLTGFAERFPGATVVSLDDNYRSTPQILTVANAVLAGEPGRRDLRPNVADGRVPDVTAYETDTAEARGVAARLRRAHRPGVPWAHLAVLARTNAQLALFEEALRAARIPYRVRGGSFLDQPEVRDALADLNRARGGPFTAVVSDLSAAAEEPNLPEERRLALLALVRLAREYAAVDPLPGADGFTAWLRATVRGDDAAPDQDAVELTTFHRAKGLEWPVVFVAGLERGLAPIGHASTPQAEAEERRLVYVALTRAREELHLSWAERRTFGTRTLNRDPSPYLQPIELACRALSAGRSAPDVRKLIAAERSRLRAVDGGRSPAGKGTGPDPVLFDALKSWRASAAKAASVPAYVIFHDSTLAAVAAARPRTTTALLAVPGLGPVKAARYGDALLDLVARHSA